MKGVYKERMIQIIGLLIWLAAIPFGIGLIPANFISEEKRTPGFVMLAGYFAMWALFEVAAIPAVLFVKYNNFRTASSCFMVLAILCAGAGVWLMYRNRKAGKPGLVFGYVCSARSNNDGSVINEKNSKTRRGIYLVRIFRQMGWAQRIEWLLFFFLLGFQLYKAAAYASFDGDDAYYVVESLIAQQADVMYRILPYTGRPTDLDVRHALAVFPMWIAFVAVKSHIHATIVSHFVMPLVLIPLSYLVYYEIGRILFCQDRIEKVADDSLFHKENLPIFMILMSLFQIFGNVSIYTNETFFLTRTWQGKAVAGSLVIPALLWVFLQLYAGGAKKRGKDAGLWMVFVCINMTAGICSSIAVFLVSILTAVSALCLACTKRDLKVILRMGAACIPNVIYIAVYVVIAYSYLLK